LEKARYMRRVISFWVLSAVWLVALPVFAEDGAPALRCTTGAHSGTYDGEAETATQITCDELRRVGARGDYEVSVSKLGSATFLSVRDPTGESRRLQIGGIEEVPIAAPRMAEALVQRTSVKSTQQVDNVVEEETRTYRKQNGEALAGIGLAGMHVFGADAFAMPAFNLRGAYETLDFAVVADLRIGGTTNDSAKQHVSALSIGAGARYFFSRGDVTPFAGGGLSYTALSYSYDWEGDASGIGAYAEAGIEALRTHKGRLAFDMRVEAPFYQISLTRYASGGSDERKVYAMPVTFGLAYSYRGI
jgi:hypothetical protein